MSMASKIIWWQEILDETNMLDKMEHTLLGHSFLGDSSRGYPAAFDPEDPIEFSALKTLRLHGVDGMVDVSVWRRGRIRKDRLIDGIRH